MLLLLLVKHSVVIVSGKDSHWQVGIDAMVTSESLGGVMVSRLGRNLGGLGSNPVLDALSPISITLTTKPSFIHEVNNLIVSNIYKRYGR